MKKEGFLRREPDSNRRIEVLQTSALPLGYRAKLCIKHRDAECGT